MFTWSEPLQPTGKLKTPGEQPGEKTGSSESVIEPPVECVSINAHGLFDCLARNDKSIHQI